VVVGCFLFFFFSLAKDLKLVILEGQSHCLLKKKKKSLVSVAAGFCVSLTCPSANYLVQVI